MVWITKKLGENKFLNINDKTGEERILIKDQKFREAEARGDFLQPVGKDKKRFLEKYKDRWKKDASGNIIEREIKKDTLPTELAEERTNFEERFKKRGKKYF